MALTELKIVSPDIKLGLWNIDENLPELHRQAISRGIDISNCSNFGSDVRKSQWLSSRILINEITDGEEVSVYYDEQGKPHFKKYNSHVSISHSDNYVSVILNYKNPTGIDIERLSDKIFNVRSRFLSENENLAIDLSSEKESLIAAWGAKEAMYKAHGRKKIEFKTDMLLEPFKFSDSGTIKGVFRANGMEVKHELAYNRIDDHIMVYLIK